MLRNIVRGVCRKPGGLALLAGAIGVLTGVEHLMSTRPEKRRRVVSKRPSLSIKVNIKTAGVPAPARRRGYFQIRQTRSEFGYVYWVLQGFGECSCFLLFDTWREAMDEAALRLHSSHPALSSSLSFGSQREMLYAL